MLLLESWPARVFTQPLPCFRLHTGGFAATDTHFSVSWRHFCSSPDPVCVLRSRLTISKLLNDGASISSSAKWESDYLSHRIVVRTK